MFSAGTKLGHYEIGSQLGAGGMGEVYLAQDAKLDRKVALKILPEKVAANELRMQRFVQEAKAVSVLNHPNILTIYEIGTEPGAHFIATEFIDGETLRQQMMHTSLTMRGPGPERFIFRWIAISIFSMSLRRRSRS